MLKIIILRFWRSIKLNGWLYTFFLIPKKLFEQKKSLNLMRSLKISSLISEYKQLPTEIKLMGGYPIDENLIKQRIDLIKKKNLELTAITFGIYDDVSFELHLKGLGMNVYSFDPSPISKTLFNENHNLLKKIFFRPIGLWTYDGSVKFYESDPKNIQTGDEKEYSIVNISNSENYVEFECKKLTTIINDLNLTYIDYLKLDIEGAVPSILNNYFNTKGVILPIQICFELEFPEKHNDKNFNQIYKDANILIKKLEVIYDIFYLPKKDIFSHLIIYGKLKELK